MTTSIDTNIIVALWQDEDYSDAARAALLRAYKSGDLVVCAPVLGELLATPKKSEAFIGSFLADTGIRVDWSIDESVWRRAGRAFRDYAAMRKRHHGGSPRRILPDFLIGAHAEHHGYHLLTFDGRSFVSAFPKLNVDIPEESA